MYLKKRKKPLEWGCFRFAGCLKRGRGSFAFIFLVAKQIGVVGEAASLIFVVRFIVQSLYEFRGERLIVSC